MNAAIKAIGVFLPQHTLTNEQLAQRYPDWGVDKILLKTGIEVRHLAGEGETAGDLAENAVRRLLATGACPPEEVDFLLLCTQSPDYFLPTTACCLQDRLGLPKSCGALDFNLGCSGFVYGLALAKGLLETGSAHHVVLVTAETYSKFLRPEDRSVVTIFGDGAAATLIGPVEDEAPHLGPFVFGTDGSGAPNLIVRAGGMRSPAGAGKSEDEYLYMNGPEVFNFALENVPPVVADLCEKAQLGLDDVDVFVFHQANAFMLETLRRKLRIPPAKFIVNMNDYGNTVSATIPMALEKALRQGAIAPGARVMVVGFGVGYSWAAGMITIPKVGVRL